MENESFEIGGTKMSMSHKAYNAIMNKVKGSAYVTAKDVAEATNFSLLTCYKYLNELVRNGKIVKVKRGVFSIINREIETSQLPEKTEQVKKQIRESELTATRLLDKNWSPLVVRKYQIEGWPMFVGMICDVNLNDLDEVVHKSVQKAKNVNFVNGSIQGSRNTCGLISDSLIEHYNRIKKGCVEGVAVIWYVDKCFISSLHGDFMVHLSCKLELFQIINTLPHI